MATQICPECKRDEFTWTYDEEDAPLTYWGCDCGYHAYEDESLERVHSQCGIKSECKLEDKNKIYWWCSSCNSIDVIKNKN